MSVRVRLETVPPPHAASLTDEQLRRALLDIEAAGALTWLAAEKLAEGDCEPWRILQIREALRAALALLGGEDLSHE